MITRFFFCSIVTHSGFHKEKRANDVLISGHDIEGRIPVWMAIWLKENVIGMVIVLITETACCCFYAIGGTFSAECKNARRRGVRARECWTT